MANIIQNAVAKAASAERSGVSSAERSGVSSAERSGVSSAERSGVSGSQQNAGQSLNAMINSFIDKEAMRRRFDELLGKRAPQFVSSLASLLNATPELQRAFFESPLTLIQAALKAATYDLPIDPALGFAYIVPFKNNKKGGVSEAQFILGYKGMQQLALRTGAYKKLNVVDIRQGELKSYNRLTEEIDIEFIEDEDQRESTPIIGYVGYFKLINGTEKTIYMSVKQIDAHEKKHRKGQYRGKGWNDDYNAMCAKTVMRRLIGKWGLMSIDYQQANSQTLAMAQAIATGQFDDEDAMLTGDLGESVESDESDESGEYQFAEPGEIIAGEQEALPE